MTTEVNSDRVGEPTCNTGSENLNHYEKGTQLAETGMYQEALTYMRQCLCSDPQNPKVLNDVGAILHCLGRSKEALEHFTRARSLQKKSSEIVWNTVEAYLAIGKPNEAALLFDEMEQMGVLNIDVLNRTANLFLSQNNLADAIEMLLRSVQICPNQEILQPILEVIRSKRPRIAFFCGGDGLNFLDEILEFTRQRFEVRLFNGQSEEEIRQLMEWSDISWFEWCTNLAVIGSRQPKICKNIVRLHRYEAYESWLKHVNWANMDILVTVGNSFVRDVILERIPYIESTTSLATIPNGVNLEKFSFTTRQRGKNIALLSNLRMVKNPQFILQCIQKLHYIDSDYRLFIAGMLQDPMLEQYLRHMVHELGLNDVVFFDGWQTDVCSWLADKHYITSTSIIESQGMGLLEAMACGLKPVIHNFPGANQIFPSEYLFNISEEFCDQICSDSYEPEKYRKFVEEQYALNQQLSKVNNIFRRLETEINSQPAGAQCWDYSKDLESISAKRGSDVCSPIYDGKVMM